MAPSPEYDKEPKAPDKSSSNISSEDTNLLHNLINDQQHNSDHKTTNPATNSEVQTIKHVETLDDDKLRALLNEALTYKCPKDREGKSSLFKELLEEVEQDDQEACEAAARSLTGCRGSRRGARGRPPLPHSNSLQDLVAALAAEPAPRKHPRHHAPAGNAHQPHSTVSARAIHGGSLPSGVDTSSLLSEEGSMRPGHGAGYLATVRCVNPPPLAERRVSASDANAPHELELLNRRSKPMFPMTYTARATLEIGSGSVCSGRAVTTTTASNQVLVPTVVRPRREISDMSTPPVDSTIWGSDADSLNPPSEGNDIELEEIICHRATKDNRDTGAFSDYLADQEKLFRILGASHSKAAEEKYCINAPEYDNATITSKGSDDVEPVRKSARDVSSENDVNTSTNTENVEITRECSRCESIGGGGGGEVAVRPARREERAPGDRYILAELPNNAYIFLTLPKRLLTSLNREYRPAELTELEGDAGAAKRPPEPKSKKKRDKPPVGTSSSAKRKDTINKNALRVLLFENLLKSDRGEPTPGGASSADKEVDSAIPFSCITTPEVVASCNTTPSASQAVAALDPKPLQMETEYRAVASVAAAPPAIAPAPALAPAPAPALASATASAIRARADAGAADEQPRSIIASSFNGLPLSRPNYGATSTATTSSEDYKKSLDENGNSVQGFSSPLSGSSQHKKPRRKKSSKNETVIDCRQIDGYQGDKDVNELLRFIESNPEQRAPKLRAKHKDDTDDKGKKRSSERRKDKDKPKRASSLEELSRTKLEDLTSAPRAAPAKPERRSWGDAAPSAPAPAPPALTPALAPAVEQADFQTVTKKRKPRRRTEETAPRRARAPSPRRQDSAPPSDRSNDSNDDMDSVHSLPERERAHPAAPNPPPLPPALTHVSYADIARTRHNIPDLIESCNFYVEADGGLGRRRGEIVATAPAALPDADTYPALDPRAEPAPPPPPAPRRAPRDKTALPAATRRDPKERPPVGAVSPPVPPAECPAPDVLADRRPPVILLDSLARPRDMDGVTFGFDINEQLLGSGARRPRCDLVRDAVESEPPAAPLGPAEPPTPAPEPPAPGTVSVRAAKRALRYVPPPAPPDCAMLHQIIDYVGNAWEEVVRCGGGGGAGGGAGGGGGGKVRYYSE